MRINTKHLPFIILLISILTLIIDPALAEGGLEKVDKFIDNVLAVLRGISLGIVTIAIMWAGYKFLFKQADIAECGKILAGGLLIWGAAELAGYLLSD